MSETEKLLYQLNEKFDQHAENDDERFDKLLKAQQVNTDSIAELTENTSSIIKLHRDLQGTVRVGKGVQRFMLYCLKWGMIGTGVIAIIKWIVDYFSN